MINTWSIPDKVEDLYPKRALELEKSRRTLVDYFLKNNKLIFVDEKYTDNSRTGSCGAIEMNNKIYYNEGELIQTRTNGGCYEPRIKLEWLDSIFEKVYQISIDKIN